MKDYTKSLHKYIKPASNRKDVKVIDVIGLPEDHLKAFVKAVPTGHTLRFIDNLSQVIKGTTTTVIVCNLVVRYNDFVKQGILREVEKIWI